MTKRTWQTRKKWASLLTNGPFTLCYLRPVYSDTTRLDVELSTRSQREQLSPINERSDPVDSVCRS